MNRSLLVSVRIKQTPKLEKVSKNLLYTSYMVVLD